MTSLSWVCKINFDLSSGKIADNYLWVENLKWSKKSNANGRKFRSLIRKKLNDIFIVIMNIRETVDAVAAA